MNHIDPCICPVTKTSCSVIVFSNLQLAKVRRTTALAVVATIGIQAAIMIFALFFNPWAE